ARLPTSVCTVVLSPPGGPNKAWTFNWLYSSLFGTTDPELDPDKWCRNPGAWAAGQATAPSPDPPGAWAAGQAAAPSPDLPNTGPATATLRL
ncbi:hypothetical protein P7K49_000218, partial [Saguinus oedipus]